MTYTYERVATPSNGLRLHLNENTAGCSPRVLAAIRALGREDLAFYPAYEEAVAACASHLHVSREELLLTNGLDEGILAAAVASARDRRIADPEALVVVPAFDMYAACADASGLRVVEIPSDPDFAFPLRRVLDTLGSRTRVVFLTTPGNPAGGSIAARDILAVADAGPHVLVFVDEAYADFTPDTLLDDPDLRARPNIVFGRTFAKAYGLAALRVGALVGAPGTLAPLRRVVPPYSLNVCAAIALRAALEDTAYHAWYVAQVRESRTLLQAALGRLGVRSWTSEANFLLADFGADAARVVAGLAERGIHVRDRSSDPACPGCVRITAGIVEHTRSCIDALEEVLCGGAS